jgi:hypothetical protein
MDGICKVLLLMTRIVLFLTSKIKRLCKISYKCLCKLRYYVWQTCNWILCCRWEYWSIVFVRKWQYVGWLIKRNRTRLSSLKLAHLQNAMIISVIISSNTISTLSLGWTFGLEQYIWCLSQVIGKYPKLTRIILSLFALTDFPWINFREDEGLTIYRNFGNNLSLDSA